jgi:eukaryotic-like serine/threonine-protein kinase
LAIHVGDTVGDYRVTGVLGAGGMGTVYQVRHLISDRTEAMKVLLPDLEGNPELAERFLREIRLQASLSHPAIAVFHTALRHENQLLMVMEYVPGDSLDLTLRRRGLAIPAAVDITLQLLKALSYAHSRGVIHRDIKPANVIVMPNGKVKLMDFGIARPLSDPRLTNTGAAIGSLHYMSPEQLRGSPVDSRTDLYSTGVTLYEMTTGIRPFTADDAYAVMKAQMEQTPSPPELLNSNISAELSQIILRALKKDPDQRFQSADEFIDVLEQIYAQFGAAVTVPVVSRASSFPTPKPAGSSAQAVVIFEPEGLERVARSLAVFIGPLAKVLVTRAAKKAVSWDDLYHKLAVEVPAGKDREAFLASRRR